MKYFIIIYIEDYLFKEEKQLNDLGIQTLRFSSFDNLADLNKRKENIKSILRSKRIDLKTYIDAYKNLYQVGYILTNTPELYALHKDFKLNYNMLKEYSPKSSFFSKKATINEIKKFLIENKFSLPLFVRTDTESVYKYMGIKGCLIENEIKTDLINCLLNIDTYIRNYSQLIIKEIAKIKETSTKISYEYRSIIIDNIIISYEFDSNLPMPSEIGIDDEIRKIVEQITENGFRGSYFMDFAITQENKVIIVETKDLINGTIHNTEDFAKNLIAKI